MDMKAAINGQDLGQVKGMRVLPRLVGEAAGVDQYEPAQMLVDLENGECIEIVREVSYSIGEEGVLTYNGPFASFETEPSAAQLS